MDYNRKEVVGMNNLQVVSRESRSFGADILNQCHPSCNTSKGSLKPAFNKPLAECAKPPSSLTMDIELQSHAVCQSEDYTLEINSYIFSRTVLPIVDYFPQQPEISIHMRGVLLNWLVNVHLKYQLAPETLFLTVDIIDQFLSKQAVTKRELQLVGITSLWIAAKYHEVYQVPKMSNLVYISDNAYTKKDILEMETKIMEAIQFNLLEHNLITYIELILKNANLDCKDKSFARYFAELCLLDWVVRTKDQKALAAGIIYLVRRMRKETPCWPEELAQLTGVC